MVDQPVNRQKENCYDNLDYSYGVANYKLNEPALPLISPMVQAHDAQKTCFCRYT